MQMCFAINIAQQHSRLCGHSPQFRFNGPCVHNREIGDDAIITQVRPATTLWPRLLTATRRLFPRANCTARTASATPEQLAISRDVIDACIPDAPGRIVVSIGSSNACPWNSFLNASIVA
jgi:hypothetical protein